MMVGSPNVYELEITYPRRQAPDLPQLNTRGADELSEIDRDGDYTFAAN